MSQSTFRLSAEWPLIIRKSGTMEAGSAVFKVESSTRLFIYFFLWLHTFRRVGDLSAWLLTAAHQSEQPLSEVRS